MNVNEDKVVETNAALGDGPFLRTANAVLREIAGEHLLVPVRRGNLLDAESLYILDDVGAWLWKELNAPQTLRELVDGVREVFDETAGHDVEADVREWIADLAGQGMVKAEGDA